MLLIKNTSEIKNSLALNDVVVLKNNFQADENAIMEYYDKELDSFHWIPMEENLETGDKTGNKWIDIRYDPSLPNSFRNSDTRQPLHTDGSYEKEAPDVTFFVCVKNLVYGGSTVFLDGNHLAECLEYYDKELFKQCTQVELIFSKGNDFKKRPIITFDSKGPILTWNFYRIDCKKESHYRIRDGFHFFLENKMFNSDHLESVKLMPGECLFFNDERVLHGRNSFVAKNKNDRLFLKGGLCMTKK